MYKHSEAICILYVFATEIKDTRFHEALPDLEFYIKTVKSMDFEDDSTIVSALIQTCQ